MSPSTPENFAEMEGYPTAWRRSFWSLIVTQFQGAFSDLTLKTLVIFIIIGMALSQEKRDALVPIVGALFALPFILFSMLGGYFADRCSKRSVTISIKIFEISVMLFTLAALGLKNLGMELTSVFLMGVHSAIFGPSKYGLLPELLPPSKLSWGNGIIELGTFVAIILGTAAGAVLSDLFGARQAWSGVILIGLAVFGLCTSLGIARVPAAAPEKKLQANFVGELVRQIRFMYQDRVLWLANLGNIYFSFLAALLQMNIIVYGKDVLNLGNTQNSYLQAAVAIGIGLGSVSAGYLSGGKIEYGLIPLGSLGMATFALLLGLPHLTFASFGVYLAVLGAFGGFFIVPVAALLQHRPDKGKKGGVLAAANLLSFVGVFVASGAYYLLTTVCHFGAAAVFLWSAVMTLAGTAYVLYLLPDSFLRFILWLLTHSVYRIRVCGRENVPAKGGALFVSNHLSAIDALLLLASTDRFIRFIVSEETLARPLVGRVARVLGAIPISTELKPHEMKQAYSRPIDSIKKGEVVCIFAEGQITRIGQMLPFRREVQYITENIEAPVIPVCLDGVWGSIFSFADGHLYWKWPRRIPYPVTVSFGSPMAPGAKPFEVRQAVQELQSQSWHLRRQQMLPLHRAFLETARRYPFRFAMADANGPHLRYASVLTRTILLARTLRSRWAGQKKVGLLLPPSVAGALANFAALLMGKVPVNLNYTLSEETIVSCVKQCGIESIVTTKAFLEKTGLKLPCAAIFLEDAAAGCSFRQKAAATLAAWFLPPSVLGCLLGSHKKTSLDDLATVIFSSGSTGEPKGVMLTHYNIASNVQQLGQVFGIRDNDRLLGVLPFFHSFGFTAALMLPASQGMGVVYHPNPLDGKAVGPLVRKDDISFLLGTPTFLQLYLRACAPEHFGSLRLVLAAAEKLPDRLASAFEEKFGIRPVEAYGCTECSPAVTVNTHDFRGPGCRQVGAKRGKIGHPLPGISVRIVDPESHAPLPVGEPGLLLLRGPNVMKGYLGSAEKTSEVLRDGWYATGDIAVLDSDGFIEITGRLSRFSKIGGEMVPHLKIEEKLHELSGLTEQTFAVTGVPDEKKGERLVVIHTAVDGVLEECLEKLPGAGLPNLWVPRRDQYFRVERLPVLGTGKLDLRSIREQALKLSTSDA